jgi:hypothetical protein
MAAIIPLTVRIEKKRINAPVFDYSITLGAEGAVTKPRMSAS